MLVKHCKFYKTEQNSKFFSKLETLNLFFVVLEKNVLNKIITNCHFMHFSNFNIKTTTSQCAQSKAAWLERGGRRCSVQDPNQASYQRRWVNRNRVEKQQICFSYHEIKKI